MVDSSHRIFVLDAGHGRIQVFASDGRFVKTLGFGIGRSPGRFLSPTCLFWVEPDNLIGVLDMASSSTTILSIDGSVIERLDLPRHLEYPRAALRLPTGAHVVSAFSLRDSTTLHLVSPRFRVLESGGRWPADRPTILFRQFGGAVLGSQPSIGVVAIQRNPGKVELYDLNLQLTAVMDLSDLVPAADTAVLWAGPGGVQMARSTRVREITGTVPLGAQLLLLSVSRPASFDAMLVVLDLRDGARRATTMPDPVEVLGCAFPEHIIMRQVVGAEYIVLYRVLEPKGVCMG
ncbi:MAG: hypothetical protein OEW06_13615 [Gemmatimonadota bacterium]|nr:hypothetical protein [Gemmatimonadota bacterium]